MKDATRQLLRVKVHKLGFPISHQLLKFLEEKMIGGILRSDQIAGKG
jgi:hypothetical protein